VGGRVEAGLSKDPYMNETAKQIQKLTGKSGKKCGFWAHAAKQIAPQEITSTVEPKTVIAEVKPVGKSMQKIIVVVGNTHTQISCEPKLRKQISHLLSYEVQGAFFARRAVPYWDGRVRLLTKDDTFPTGLLFRLQAFLQTKGIQPIVEDKRTAPRPSLALELALPWEPRDYQFAALEIAKKEPRGVYQMSVSSGKTATAAMVIACHKTNTLFVTPDTGLREQAFNDFEKWFNVPVSKNVTATAPIIVANIQSLMNKDPKFFARFKMLVIDEFHHSAAETYLKLNKWCVNAYYRYGFTGTFLRTDGSDMSMHGVLSKVIFKKTASELIEEGYIVRPHITITRHATPRMHGYDYKRAYDYIIRDGIFNKRIADIANEKISEKRQTLILVRRKEHGETLAAMIPKASYLSGDDDTRTREQVKAQFNRKEIPCLIATAIFGEGIDIPCIDVLINARCQKTEIQTVQGIGRALRKAPGKDMAEVYDFLIVGQKHLQAHSVERILSYKKEPAFLIRYKKS